MKRPFVVYALLGVLLLVCSRWWFADWWLHREYPLGDWGADSVSGQVSGVLTAIEQKNTATWYYLKDCIVSLSGKADFQNCEIGSFLVKVSYSESENIFTDNQKHTSGQENASQIILGAKMQAVGEIQTFEAATNPGQFDSRGYYAQRNLFYQMRGQNVQVLDAPRWSFRQMLWEFRQYLAGRMDALWNQRDAGVIKAMLLGEKSGLDSERKSLYTRNGIGHLLAISGLHMAVFAMGLYGLLSYIGMSNRIRAGLCILVLFAYGCLTGLSVATNRAMLMMTLFFMAKILGRAFDRKNALGFAAVVILCQTPAALYGSGFLLSFGAMLGVCYVCPVCREMILGQVQHIRRWKAYTRRLAEGNWSRKTRWYAKCIVVKVADSFAFSMGIQVATLPLIAWFYFEIPPYGIILNLLLIPIMSVLVVTAVVAVFLGGIWPPVASVPVWLTHIILQLYDKVCKVAECLPGSKLVTGKPQMWQMILYYGLLAGILLGWYLYKKTRTKGCDGNTGTAVVRPWNVCRIFACMAGICGLVCVLLPGKVRDFRMTFLDVGQGDCIFFQTEGGSYLVDGGSSSVSGVGQYRILPYLKSQAVKRLDYVWISHLDKDHVNGITELLSMGEGVEIGALFLSETSYYEPEAETLLELCRQKQVKVCILQRGDQLRQGELSVACLYPQGKAEGDYDKNAWSQVLMIQYGTQRILLTGDLGLEGEDWLVENGEIDTVTVLKAGHHGSKYASGERLLQAARAKVAVFSAGRKNRYGHPHPDTIERVEQCGMDWISTAQAGAVFLQGNTDKMKMWSYIQ